MKLGSLSFIHVIVVYFLQLTIRCKDVAAMTKEKMARVIPNSIQICTKDEKHFFTSFSARDKTYLMMFRVWQNALLDQVKSYKIIMSYPKCMSPSSW